MDRREVVSLDTAGLGVAGAGDAGVAVSFIVPAFNASRTLAATVSSIRAQAPDSHEVIVVDDGSFDDTVAIAFDLADHVLVRPCQGGAARARNDGAQVARGDILIFVDSDVTVRPGAIPGMLAHFDEGVDAVFGAYEALPPAEVRNGPTTYKNLLHHYTHLEGSGEASTFWSGFGGVRRDAFRAVRGFAPGVTTAADVEDIHLGYRLRGAGYRILLDSSLRVVHHKRYTLRGLIDSDLVHRAIPWTRAMLELRTFRSDLNLGQKSIVSAVVTYVVVASLLALPLVGPWALSLLAVSSVGWWALNRRFLGYVRREWSFRGMLVSAGLHTLYYLYGPLGAVLGVLAYLLRHDHDSFLNHLALTEDPGDYSLPLTVAVIRSPGDPEETWPEPVPSVWEFLVIGATKPEWLPHGGRFHLAPASATRNQMRDIALRVAAGRMLALVDGRHAPGPGWIDRVLSVAQEGYLAVGGSFDHDRRGLLRRALQVARYWQWRPERSPAWLVDHPGSNIVVRTSVARGLGGFVTEGALLLRLAGFGARPLRFDPQMRVSITGDASLLELTRGLAGVGRLRAAASVRYFDVGWSARLAMVAISPAWALAGLYHLVRSAVREGSADRTFWAALPLAVLGAAAHWVGRNLGALWPGDRGGVIPRTEAEIQGLARGSASPS